MAKILLLSYDNSSHHPFYPQNIHHLTGYMKTLGHAVAIYFMDIHHGKPKSLLPILAEARWDFVGLGSCAGYYQYRRMKEVSDVINSSPKRTNITYVLGGHGPAAEPEFFLDKMGASAVVVGDGEYGLEAVVGGARGVVHGKAVEADLAPLDTYHDFPLSTYRLIRFPTSTATDFCQPILSSRGCKWSCTFCYRMRSGFYERPVGAIIEEIRWLNREAMINHFQFSDELLMSSEKRTVEICEAILSLPFKIKWDANGRLNHATRQLLSLMRKSGCEYINYGIESLDQGVLNQMKKGLTVEQIHQGVEATIAAGIVPGLNIIWGNHGDTIESLNRGVEFLLQYDSCAELRTIRPVSPYPGSPLYDDAIKAGLLEGPEDFYENKHKNSDLLTVNFTDIPDKDFHEALWRANNQLIWNYSDKRAQRVVNQGERLYMKGDTSFRGFREV